MHNNTIKNHEGGYGSLSNISNETINGICDVLKKNLIEGVSPKLLSRIVKLLLMTERNLRNNSKASCLIELYRQSWSKDKPSDIQWEPPYPSHNEDNLWNISAMHEVQGCLPSIVNNNELSGRFRALETHKDPSLGLMLWLFPALVTKERLKMVYGIVCKDLRNWTIQDKMLFWLACVQNQKKDCWVTEYVEEQILRLQLDSGAFANVEGKDTNENVISSAMGLMVLVSCAKLKSQNGSAFDAARKTASWIVTHLKERQDVETLSCAWSLYALSEFINLVI